MRKLRKKQKRLLLGTGLSALAIAAVSFIVTRDYAVLNAKGTIAQEQKELLIFATLLSLVVILPVFALTFYIVWKYRADHATKRTPYMPDWEHSRKLEALWWGIPGLIILVLSVVTWQSSHALDPYKPLDTANANRPMTIQVIALPWKWLFIYPEQNIATVNYVQFPEDTPVHFQITADAPMNSFWIPQLGGQVYAMTGMSTSLHLMATEKGDYAGSSANLSGKGFAGMRFTARASTQREFDLWAATTRAGRPPLDTGNYRQLASPSSDQPVSLYSLKDPQLYDTIVDKYNHHGAKH